jgi:hypothetical protein
VKYTKMKLPLGCRAAVREALQDDGVAILWEITDPVTGHSYRDHNKVPCLVKLIGLRVAHRSMLSMLTFHDDWQVPTWDVEGMRKSRS